MVSIPIRSDDNNLPDDMANSDTQTGEFQDDVAQNSSDVIAPETGQSKMVENEQPEEHSSNLEPGLQPPAPAFTEELSNEQEEAPVENMQMNEPDPEEPQNTQQSSDSSMNMPEAPINEQDLAKQKVEQATQNANDAIDNVYKSLEGNDITEEENLNDEPNQDNQVQSS